MALLLSGCATWTHGVPELHQVAPGLYRSGEPTAVGWTYLRDQLGVRTRVQLDFDHERRATPPAGVTVLEHPMPPQDIDDVLFEDAPTRAEVDAAVDDLEACLAAAAGACAAGCRHGHDRTGLLFFVYRLRHGWTWEAAYAEAVHLGFHPALLGLRRVMELYR